MRVYFVRHGESIFNTQNRHQYPETPLSEIGQKQAELIAQRLSSVPLDLLISSTHTRALQTAQVIERLRPVDLIQSDLFIERKVPSSSLGKIHTDPEVSEVHKLLKENADDKNWHYSDEENFHDLLVRANKALSFITSQKKDSVAVVTHGYFLMVLICNIMFGDDLTYQNFTGFKDNMELSNTGLTLCEYIGNWKILTINDFAHLGDES